jgi:hypothetical protein
MNHRAGGNQNGRSSRSSRTSESSDLVDMKALAAATARPTAAVPAVRGAELSGMVGRRDSVVGARIDDRAPISAGLSWMWLVAGCVAVLAPGSIGVWLVGRTSDASASVAAPLPKSSVVAFAAPVAPESAAPVEIEPLPHLQALIPDSNDGPRPAVRGPGGRRYYRHRSAEARRAAAAAMASAAVEGARPGAPAVAAGAGTAPGSGPGAGPAVPPAEAAAGADDDDKPAKAEEPEKPKKVVEAAPEEPTNGPPRTVKELRSALARLQSRVVQCHQRFQVDGVADVKVAVNPTGTVESASLAGEFEGTPTGDCIVRLVSAASFPTFDGTESIRVSHSFSLE